LFASLRCILVFLSFLIPELDWQYHKHPERKNKIHIVYSFIEDSDFKIFVVKIDIQFILVNYA